MSEESNTRSQNDMSVNKELLINVLNSALELNRAWYKYDSVDLTIDILDNVAHSLFDAVLDDIGFIKSGTTSIIGNEEVETNRDYIVRYLDSATQNPDATAEKMYTDLVEIKKAEDLYGDGFDIEPWL